MHTGFAVRSSSRIENDDMQTHLSLDSFCIRTIYGNAYFDKQNGLSKGTTCGHWNTFQSACELGCDNS